MPHFILMILTNGFDPDVRMHKQAKALAAAGHRVELFCWDREGRHRDKPFEQLDGFTIRRCFIPSRYGSGLRQLLPFFRFMGACRRYIHSLPHPPDYCHCADLDGMLAGLFGRRKKTRLVFDMREFYESGTFRRFRLPVRFLVRRMQDCSETVVYVNETQRAQVRERNREKLVFLPNYPLRALGAFPGKTPCGELRISYIGYVRHLPQLRGLLAAAGNRPGVRLKIYGGGVVLEQVQRLAEPYENCAAIGPFPYSEVGEIYRQTDLLYCVYDAHDPNDRTAYPTKLFEAIATGTPILAAAGTVLGDFCLQKGIGFSVEEDYCASIKKILDTICGDPGILKQMSARERQLSPQYIWETAMEGLLDAYSRQGADKAQPAGAANTQV